MKSGGIQPTKRQNNMASFLCRSLSNKRIVLPGNKQGIARQLPQGKETENLIISKVYRQTTVSACKLYLKCLKCQEAQDIERKAFFPFFQSKILLFLNHCQMVQKSMNYQLQKHHPHTPYTAQQLFKQLDQSRWQSSHPVF